MKSQLQPQLLTQTNGAPCTLPQNSHPLLPPRKQIFSQPAVPEYHCWALLLIQSQITLKSPAYSVTETPWNSRGQHPNSAEVVYISHILGPFLKRVYLTCIQPAAPLLNHFQFTFNNFSPYPPQIFSFFPPRLSCAFNALHNWQQKKSWGVFCFRQPLPSWMNTPFPKSWHSAPCRCTSDASTPPLCSSALWRA